MDRTLSKAYAFNDPQFQFLKLLMYEHAQWSADHLRSYPSMKEVIALVLSSTCTHIFNTTCNVGWLASIARLDATVMCTPIVAIPRVSELS